MGKGGNVAEWKLKVDAAYKEWKQDALHRKIKLCFTAANEQSKLPVVLRQKVEGDSPFKAHLSSLKETTYKEKVEDKKIAFVRDSRDHSVTFLGTKIDCAEAVDDDEVSKANNSLIRISI